ncbi:MAG: hypothetical protein JW990_10680 [Thermoleophilia bacterium]|nr:hypothetical protein [Thermoleophilia bacterium]
MKTGRSSRDGTGARRRRRLRRPSAAAVTGLLAGLLLVTAGFLAVTSGGCGVDDGSSTSAPSTTSTGDVPLVTITSWVTTDSVGAEGTRRDPIPLGQDTQVGDWKVRVVDAELDATQRVLDENMFNDPPDSESQYVLVTLEAMYVGQESSTFWIDMMYSFVGDEGDAFGVASTVAPDSITNDGEVTKGEIISGNLVFLVATKQASGGTLMLEETFSWDGKRVFFAVE